MNHNFGRDLLALDRLLPLRLRYVGLLGPRKRHAELLARLSEYRPLDFETGSQKPVRAGRTRHRQRSAGRNRARDRVRSRGSAFREARRFSARAQE